MVTLENTSLTLEFSDKSDGQFHYAWLRDNCRCVECLHPDTAERILITSEIPDDIAPTSAEIKDAQLVLIWNHQAHHSEYSLDWLQQHNYSRSELHNDPAFSDIKVNSHQQLWGNELEDKIPTFNYGEICSNDEVLLKWCVALRDYGLTIVRDAPLEEAQIERFADHIGVVRETIFDRLHNVRATPGEYNAYNVASTTLELKPHTDMPCYNNPPGVQMFHFLENEAQGGESTAVDGFHIAALLKESDPEAFDLLSTQPVDFKMFSSRGDVQSSNPVFTLDSQGQMKVFRFSNQTAQPSSIAADQMDGFYRAYRKLGRMIEDPSNKVVFKLGTGDMMVTNNLRVMHGRNSYDGASGNRHLQLSYMDMDDVLSRIRVLLKKVA